MSSGAEASTELAWLAALTLVCGTVLVVSGHDDLGVALLIAAGVILLAVVLLRLFFTKTDRPPRTSNNECLLKMEAYHRQILDRLKDIKSAVDRLPPPPPPQEPKA